MNEKHLRVRIQQCLALSELSPCPRRKFGAMLIDEETNVVIADGYNGSPRGAKGSLCFGDVCEREGIVSGTRLELGCHHAEMNVICNAAARGAATKGKTLIVTGEPCLMCAKILHHAGVKKVILISGGYRGGTQGVDYLRLHGIVVKETTGPQDPRGEKSERD